MTLVDWAIVIVLAVATIGGITQGLLRSVCSLCGLIFGLMLAAWNYERVATMVRPIVRIEAVANAIGFLLIALLVMLIANLVGMMISKTVHKIGLGCLDRIAGAAFGLVQGAVLVTISILVTLAFFPNTTWLAEGKLPKYFLGACHITTRLTPGELADRVRHGIDEMEQHTPEWMHSPGEKI
jgi:membrane protein required for colicin V production